jgi:hypothetical protein
MVEAETSAESIILDEAENQSFLGFIFGTLINSEKSVVFQQLRKRPHELTLVTCFLKDVHERGLDDSELVGLNSICGSLKAGPDEVVRRIGYWDSLECVGVINIAQTAWYKFGQSCVRSTDQATCSPVLSADPKPKRK